MIDLSEEYWQILMARKDQEIFWGPWGLFEFMQMTFGLHGAPTTFQLLMDHLLTPHMAYTEAYIDDIIIYSQSWDQHLWHLRAVLDEIQDMGMIANPRKCALSLRKTNYLGFRVGQGVIQPLASKIEVIENYRPL